MEHARTSHGLPALEIDESDNDWFQDAVERLGLDLDEEYDDFLDCADEVEEEARVRRSKQVDEPTTPAFSVFDDDYADLVQCEASPAPEAAGAASSSSSAEPCAVRKRPTRPPDPRVTPCEEVHHKHVYHLMGGEAATGAPAILRNRFSGGTHVFKEGEKVSGIYFHPETECGYVSVAEPLRKGNNVPHART
jgi:hypothetical protein